VSLDRTIVIRNDGCADAAIAVIRANYVAMAESDRPLAVRIYEHRENRSLEQQSLMWIRLGEIASQAWVGGRQFSAECWHEHAKREFLPDDDGPTKRARKGYAKWAVNPMSGERVLVGSTTQLTVFGMSEYMQALEAFGAGLGVRFAATPREMAGYR
jgi:hypothetical protein